MGKSKPSTNKPAKTIRNVMVQPFKTQWPTVSPDEGEKLSTLLKHIPTDQVVHGTNPVNQLLSNGLACVLLISSDFHPQILGKQIIQMARRNVPDIVVLAMENLSWNGKLEKLVAIRRSENQYPEIVQQLIYLMKDISLSKGYYEKSVEDCAPKNKKHEEKQSTKAEIMPLEDIQKLYLPRPTNGKRAFVPAVSTFANTKSSETEKDWGQFISLKRSKSDSNDNKPPNKKKITLGTNNKVRSSGKYVALTVNRVQANPNRKAEKRKKT